MSTTTTPKLNGSQHEPAEFPRARSAAGWGRVAIAGVRRFAGVVPIRWLGLLVVVGAAMVMRWVALPQRDLVLLVVTSGVLLIAAISIVAVTVGALVVAWRLRSHREDGAWSMETERLLPTSFYMPSLVWLPLVQVRWSWETPIATVSVTSKLWSQRENVRVARRGHYDSIVRSVRVEDVFGLAGVRWRSREHRALRVLPHGGALGQLPTLASMSAGDTVPNPLGVEEGDRIELRRYAPGDPMRFIHWKIFARSRKLMVRKPERSLTQTQRTVAYLIGSAGDEASSGAARVALENGALGSEWTFAADGSEGETGVLSDAIERVLRSADAPDSEGARGLEDCIRRADRLGPSSLVLFAPSRPGPWLDRAVTSLESRAQRAKVVVAVDGVSPPPASQWWRRLLIRDAPADGALLDELERVLQRLAATRCAVVVLDRRTGRQLATEHRDGMRALRQALSEPRKAA